MIDLAETTSDAGRISADLIAADAADAFAAAARGENVLQNVMLGLGCVLQITHHPGMLRMPRAVVQQLEQAVVQAGLVLAEQDECKFSNSHHLLGMVGALATVSFFGKTKEEVTTSATLPLVLDYTDHMSLLMAELVVSVVEKRIQERGNVLQRALAGHAVANYSHKPSATTH